jgi:NAD+ diphosphatase
MTFFPAPFPPGTPPARGNLWFAIDKRGLLARRVGTEPRGGFALPTETDLRALGVLTEDAHLFGRWGDNDVFALSMPSGDDSLAEGWSMLGLRGLVEAFDEPTFAIAGHATHVLDWATTSRFCGRCGAATVPSERERCMVCPECSLTIYPRIAPAVIVLVRKGELALLARNARFPLPFFSTIAGFSNIGETLEETVRREVLEEVGVRVGSTRYFGSQPWPFPNSLMLAFMAAWDSGEIKVDQDEIAEANWFSADALPMIPPRISIARHLIDAWLEEVTGRRRAYGNRAVGG